MSDSTATTTLLEQDPQRAHQKYCLFSFLPRKEDIAKRFNKCRYERIQGVLETNRAKLLERIQDDPDMIAAHVMATINDTLRDVEEDEGNERHRLNGAVKFRGAFENMDDAKAYSKHLSDLDNRFDIYLAQAGCWVPFDPSNESVEQHEFRDEKLNDLMQGYLKNKAKADIFFKKRMREMTEDKITRAAEAELSAEEAGAPTFESTDSKDYEAHDMV
jgi:hypothetical protein